MYQKIKVYDVAVVFDMYGLGISGGVGVDLPVCRIRRVAVGIAGFGERHAFNLLEEMFRSPEASSGKINGIHIYRILESLRYQMMNQTSAISTQTPPVAYDISFGSDNPSGAMQMYVEHTDVISNAGINAI